MLATIKAEARKLLTVRSTYFIVAFALLLAGFVAFYAIGYKSGSVIPENGIQRAVFDVISVVPIFLAIIAILLITHEYRYNTISYTLTSSNSRMKVLLAKLLVVSVFTIAATLVFVAWIAAVTLLGVHMAGHRLLPQNFDYLEVLWKSVLFMVTGSLAGLVIGFLSRSVVFAIVAYFLIPTTVEPILNSLLKVNANYLPFMAQSQILIDDMPKAFSPLASAGVFTAYLAGAWIVAAILFVRKDAN
ncbi:MAG TPA: ABC transporter permease [Candidatus Saccharimonadales bacterium]|nr:ABC transporter permease [Candidatus Saccharimonadales bacterium]